MSEPRPTGTEHDPDRPDTAAVLGPLVTRIDHVGLAVGDFDAAVEFYRRTFGLPLVHEEVNVDQGVREGMLAIGDAFLQLLAPIDQTSTIAKFLSRNGPGVQQVAFGVDDVVAAAARLRAAGLRVLYDTPRPGTYGSLVNFVHPKDCGGVLVELVQAAGHPGN